MVQTIENIKSTLLILILTSFVITSQAQNKYSPENLENTSIENLNTYLEKAKRNKKTGAILSIAGPIAFISGGIVFVEYWENSYLGYISSPTAEVVGSILVIGGMAATLTGIPLYAINSSRINKINNTLSNKAYIELVPYHLNRHMAQTNQYGITLRIRF